MVRTSPGLLRSLIEGCGYGAGVGALWWLAEITAHHVGGSLVSSALVRQLAQGDVLVGAVAGLAVGGFVRREPGTLALCVAAAFGFLRVWSPPGMAAEGASLAVSAVTIPLGRWLLGPDRRTGWSLLLVSLFASLTFSLFEITLNEFHLSGVRGLRLPVVVGALPLLPVVLDRLAAQAVVQPSRRLLIALVGTVAACGFLQRPLSTAPEIGHPTTAPPPAGSPDIILVVLDTVRADHLSTYGYGRETSPRLSEFAADALLFEQARSTAGWTLPGHASMFTGLFPSRHGARAAGGWLPGQSVDGRRNVAYPLAPEQNTLAEILSEHGYRTAAVVANFSYLYRTFGFAQGFDLYDDAPWQLLRFRSPLMHAIERRWPTAFARPYRSGLDINAAAWSWFDAGAGDRPSFVFLNYMDAHPPYVAPEPYTEWTRTLPAAPKLARRDLYAHAPRALTTSEQTYLEANYDGQIRAADAAFGALLDELKRRGRYDGALIIVTSDHGTLLGEHGEVGHVGRMLYEPLLRIPLVVKFPGATHPRGRVTTPVQNVDVFPTALAAAGIAAPAATQGEALPHVSHPSLAEDDVNAFLVAQFGRSFDRALRVLVEPPFKLIATSRGDQLLFDLAADPIERHNLADRDPQRAASMTDRLRGLLPFGPAPK